MTKLIEFGISVSGTEVVSRTMGLAIEVLGDLTDVWREVLHPYLLRHMEQQFSTGGRHGGDSWPQGYTNEPKYRAFKLSMVGHLDALRWQKGGPYEKVFPSLTDRFDVNHRFVARPSKATFGTLVPHTRDLAAGGVGPFGETYQPYSIFAFKHSQVQEVVRAIQRDILRRFGADTLRTASRTANI
jgi:hypothetical protein